MSLEHRSADPQNVPPCTARTTQTTPGPQPLKRLALINPTKFLGNLLLAGGLIQHLNQWCQAQHISFLLVLDENFKELFADTFPGAELVYYPRAALKKGAPKREALKAWLACVRQIRSFRADLAFTIEEDSVCHRLTHFSGARYKISSTRERYHFGFDQVLDINRCSRAKGQQSIWYSFAEVLKKLGLPVPDKPAYVQLKLSTQGRASQAMALQQRLTSAGITQQRPLAVLHAGASKIYKKWPTQHFVALGLDLARRGYQLALIGAGNADDQVNAAIQQALRAAAPQAVCANLCNFLSLYELGQLLATCQLVVGNDSGPSHLASALGTKGAVIFGPTEIPIWRPLGKQTQVLDNKACCAADCTRRNCKQDYLCLRSVTPQDVVRLLFTEV